MDRVALIRSAVAFIAALVCGTSWAAYADLTPPKGWVRVPYSSTHYVTVEGAIAGGWFRAGEHVVFESKAATMVGGRPAQVLARMPLTSAAPAAGALAIFRSPASRFIPVVGQWLAAGSAALWLWDELSGRWTSPGVGGEDFYQSTGEDYRYGTEDWYPTRGEACAAYYETWEGDPRWDGWTLLGGACGFTNVGGGTTVAHAGETRTSSCPSGWYVVGTECLPEVEHSPLTEQQFIDGLTSSPMPDEVPGALPGVRWPVGVPLIQPTWFPIGDPVPNLDYNPNEATEGDNRPYRQPGVEIVPANDLDNPWRVDVRPKDRLQDEATPDRDPVPGGDPETWTDAGTMPDGKPSPDSDFCALHPDILACQKVGEVETVELPEDEAPFDFSPVSGFGGSASCPAIEPVYVLGYTVNLSYTPLCNALDMGKPLVLAVAWLMAAFIVLRGTE